MPAATTSTAPPALKPNSQSSPTNRFADLMRTSRPGTGLVATALLVAAVAVVVTYLLLLVLEVREAVAEVTSSPVQRTDGEAVAR